MLLGIWRHGIALTKSLLHGGYFMELKEIFAAIRHTRPWALLVFCLIAFQSLKNANPPDLVAVEEAVQQPMTMLVAQR